MAEAAKARHGIGVFRLYTEREKDQYIGALVARWERDRKAEKQAMQPSPFVTLSRPFGCMALETGLRLAERLSEAFPGGPVWSLYDREIIERISDDLYLKQKLVEQLTDGSKRKIDAYLKSHVRGLPTLGEVYEKTQHTVLSLCEKGHGVIVGRGGCVIASDLPGGFHVRVVAPFAWRVGQVATAYGVTRGEAERRTRRKDAERADLFWDWFRRNVDDPDLYDLVLNQASLPTDDLVDLIVRGMKAKGTLAFASVVAGAA